MLFSSPSFFIFFAIYFAFHLACPARLRILLVIVGSAVFYGFWNWHFVWVPFLLTAMAHVSALWMMAAPVERRRQRLTLAIIALLLPLAIVKYGNFVVVDLIGLLIPGVSKMFDVALPLAISFLTFTLVAYVVDVYKGRYPLERRTDRILAYSLFFPHLIAGPILRPRELLPQFDKWPAALSPNFVFALLLFTLGLVKKLVFADQVGERVNQIYAGAGTFGWLDYVVAIYGFAVQIYCDFSGYTDMAIGLAVALGVRLPRNFHRPYLAASIDDFWRRWHVTLSNWLRDYVYIPLGGSREGPWRRFRNLMITMTLGGLWHGANWTFVLWGAFHGCGIAVSHAWRDRMGRVLPRWIGTLATLHFVIAGWILFRAPDLAAAMRIASGPFLTSEASLPAMLVANGFCLALLAIFAILHRFDNHAHLRIAARQSPRGVLLGIVVGAWALAVGVSAGSSADFIYFNF